jgi:hypothetical protein
MRSRIAYAAVLLTGLALIAFALSGMRGMDDSLQVAASHASPRTVLEHTDWQRPDCHRAPALAPGV